MKKAKSSKATKSVKEPVKAPKKVKSSKSREASESMWVTHRDLAADASAVPIAYCRSMLRGHPIGMFLCTVKLGQDSALTSDGSGIIATVISDVPTSAQNWSNYAAVFEEYRVLALQVQFEPLLGVGGSTQTFWAPIAHVIDRTDATALTGYGLAERYESHAKTPGGRRFTIVSPMKFVEESSFLSTAGSTATRWIKFYSTGNSASLTVGRLDIRFLIEFNGLGIN